MKTFDDLHFTDRTEFRGTSYEGKTAKQATMDFPNGYGVSVLLGDMWYSNGIDTYELAVMYEGSITYNTPVTDNVLGYITATQVSEAMKQIQELEPCQIK